MTITHTLLKFHNLKLVGNSDVARNFLRGDFQNFCMEKFGGGIFGIFAQKP